MQDKEFRELLENIEENKITKISLVKDDEGDRRITNVQFSELMPILKENNSLTELGISLKSKMTVIEAELLSNTIRNHPSIIKLSLPDNKINFTNIVPLTEFLKENKIFKTLDLRKNDLKDLGVEKLCDVLKVNHSLTELNIANNNIDEGGISKLADFLKSNDTLKILNIYNNIITTQGLTYIDQALKINQSLIKININDNHMGVLGDLILPDTLKYNRTLTFLNVNDCLISKDEVFTNFVDLMKGNYILFSVGDVVTYTASTEIKNLLIRNKQVFKGAFIKALKYYEIKTSQTSESHLDNVQTDSGLSHLELYSLLHHKEYLRKSIDKLKEMQFWDNDHTELIDMSDTEHIEFFHVFVKPALISLKQMHPNDYSKFMGPGDLAQFLEFIDNVIIDAEYFRLKGCTRSSAIVKPVVDVEVNENNNSASNFSYFPDLPKEIQKHICSYLREDLYLQDSKVIQENLPTLGNINLNDGNDLS